MLPMMQAIRTERVVTFEYQAPAADVPAPRTLSPWRLAVEEGHWRVIGHDHDRQAPRTFRLSRIVGPVTMTALARVAPGTEAATDEGEDAAVVHRARIRVRAGAAAALRKAAVRDPDRWTAPEIEVEFSTRETLVRAVCAAGPDAVVLDPPEIAREVALRLRRVARQHAGATA